MGITDLSQNLEFEFLHALSRYPAYQFACVFQHRNSFPVSIAMPGILRGQQKIADGPLVVPAFLKMQSDLGCHLRLDLRTQCFQSLSQASVEAYALRWIQPALEHFT